MTDLAHDSQEYQAQLSAQQQHYTPGLLLVRRPTLVERPLHHPVNPET